MQQTHRDKFLLFYDDFGNVQNQFDKHWAVISTKKRSPHLPAKYHEMIRHVDRKKLFPKWDALAVWDDDDLYLPNHLAGLAKAMEKRKWAKPSYVFSTYSMSHGEVQLEPATGRFHGSIGVRRSHFEDVGGWPQSLRATFDQEFMSVLGAKASGDPLDYFDPTYVFRWQDTGAPHCSSRMDKSDWYEKHTAGHTAPIAKIKPRCDGEALAVFNELEV